MDGSVYSLPDLRQQVESWRREGHRIGFTCGAFDLLHAGHADYLQRARELCDQLIVAVNTDASVRSYKNPLRPIVPEQSRALLVAALRCVSAVVLIDEARPAALIEALKPDVYIKGGDYRVADLKSAPLVASYGGECAVIPIEHEISSTALIQRIQQLSAYAPPESPGVRLKGPLVLLDRDGTLIENVPFLHAPSEVKLRDGVGPGLLALQDAGFSLAVITNQQGLGLGYFDYHSFVAVNSEMLKQLAPYGVRIARFYFCPHSLAEQCACRKPGTRLVERALSDFVCAAKQCFLIGDSPGDLLAATGAGCQGLLVTSGQAAPSLSFAEAVGQILAADAVKLAADAAKLEL